MGRGKAWDSDENMVLAKAWIATSENPIVGADQKSKTFFDTLHRRVLEKGPPRHTIVNGKYGLRTVESCRKHFTELSADVQKFSVSLRKVHASCPTGVNEEGILSMAVAIHVGQTDKMDYAYQDYDKNNWNAYKAWQELHNHPKWAMTEFTGLLQSLSSEDNSLVVDTGHAVATAVENGSEDTTKMRDRKESQDERRFQMGSRMAKSMRQEGLRTNAVRSMADSAKRKSDALEERNAIAVFSRPDVADLDETKGFFKAMRATYLSQALKKARVAAAEASAVTTSGTVVPVESSVCTEPTTQRTESPAPMAHDAGEEAARESPV